MDGSPQNTVDMPVASVMAFVARTHDSSRHGDSGSVPINCHRMSWCRMAPHTRIIETARGLSRTSPSEYLDHRGWSQGNGTITLMR